MGAPQVASGSSPTCVHLLYSSSPPPLVYVVSHRAQTNKSDSSFANSSLHIRNISNETTEDSLKNHFSSEGRIREVRLVKDRNTGANMGFAFVEFEDARDAAKAMASLAQSTLDGKVIQVSYSKTKALGGGRRDGREAPQDDRRGGGRDRYGSSNSGDRYGAAGAGAAPLMGYPPYGYPPGVAAGRAGMPAFPPYYMPYGAYPGAAGGAGGRTGRDAASTAFPAYGMPPMGAGAYPYMDPRYLAAYGQMMAQGGMAGMAGQMPAGPAATKKDSKGRRSRSRSRSRSRRYGAH